MSGESGRSGEREPTGSMWLQLIRTWLPPVSLTEGKCGAGTAAMSSLATWALTRLLEFARGSATTFS